jgi:holliday junction DNA helicase RuvB
MGEVTTEQGFGGPVTDTVRPDSWDEFIGQEELKAELNIRIGSALIRERPLDHVLLCGPPGFGKTTLASLIAKESGDPIMAFTMPMAEGVIVQAVQEHSGILFLDEIHRCSNAQQEFLLPLLEEGFVETRNGQRVPNSWLTVVAATTEREKIIAPLYDRFTIKPYVKDYSKQDMALITAGMAERLGLHISLTEAAIIGGAAGGVPRNARSMIMMMRDMYADSGTMPTAQEVLNQCGVTQDGLTRDHQAYLKVLHRNRGRAGERVISSLTNLPPQVLHELERLLITEEYITLGERGRELTSKGYAFLSPDRRR